LIAILYHGIVNYATGYVMETHLWQIERFSPMWLEIIVIGLMILTALVFGLLSKTVFRKFQ
jgi:hypothetical protein